MTTCAPSPGDAVIAYRYLSVRGLPDAWGKRFNFAKPFDRSGPMKKHDEHDMSAT
jgi:hypothetical protein